MCVNAPRRAQAHPWPQKTGPKLSLLRQMPWENAMRAAEVMTRDVATVHPETSIADAIQIMVQRRVSGLPVVDAANVVVGIVSEGDLLRRVELGTEHRRPAWTTFLRGPDREAVDYVRTHTLRVEDIMTRKPDTVSETAALDEVVAHMTHRHVRRLPVTARDGTLLGIVSRADLVRALGDSLRHRSTINRDDAAIKADLVNEIRQQPWADACSVAIVVHNGHIDISGVVFQESVEAALRVAAERTDGALSVAVRTEFVSQVAIGA
jgi:CBS domain-containing protein